MSPILIAFVERSSWGFVFDFNPAHGGIFVPRGFDRKSNQAAICARVAADAHYLVSPRCSVYNAKVPYPSPAGHLRACVTGQVGRG